MFFDFCGNLNYRRIGLGDFYGYAVRRRRCSIFRRAKLDDFGQELIGHWVYEELQYDIADDFDRRKRI